MESNVNRNLENVNDDEVLGDETAESTSKRGSYLF